MLTSLPYTRWQFISCWQIPWSVWDQVSSCSHGSEEGWCPEGAARQRRRGRACRLLGDLGSRPSSTTGFCVNLAKSFASLGLYFMKEG